LKLLKDRQFEEIRAKDEELREIRRKLMGLDEAPKVPEPVT
jgi:hypothetical protein